MIGEAAQTLPSQTAPNGIVNRGRFQPGNKLAKGNPYAKKAAEVKKAIAAAVTQADIRDVVKSLIANAKAGDVHATKELFDRLIGKASQPIEVAGADGDPLRIEVHYVNRADAEDRD